ncbi:hypothetical protein IID22_00355 [Patescibacteria group bacterium]|nr:hypothetical protein [Patescibacteria group bacterium]
MDFIRFAAFFGFIVLTTLFMSLNYKGFKAIFREKTRSYWWLFIILTSIPALLSLFIFSLLFE